MKGFVHRIREHCGELWWYTALLFIAQRFGDAINMFVGMWLVPRYVPAEELGAVVPLTQAVAFVALPLSIVTIPFMKFITVFIDNGEDGKAKAFIRDVFLAVATLAVVSVVGAYFLMPLLFSRLHVECGSLGILVMAVAVLTSTSAIFGYAVQGFRMYSVTIWIQILQAPLRLMLMLIAMPFRPLSGYMIGQTAGPIVQISAVLYAFRRRFGRLVRPMPYWSEYKRAIVHYTVPFAIWSIVGTVCGTFDSLVIRHRLPELESAGYYILTRFTDMVGYLGMAAAGFLFPMVASRGASDRTARKLLRQSVVCALVGGGIVAVGLSVLGEWLLNLLAEWRAYVAFANLFPVLSLTTILSTVAGCIITFEMAQGRFRFLWCAVPISLGKTIFIYVITGFSFFQGMVPDGLIRMIDTLEPCRLKFVSAALLAGQALIVCGLLFDLWRSVSLRKENKTC